jgi:hypothetical protein
VACQCAEVALFARLRAARGTTHRRASFSVTFMPTQCTVANQQDDQL